MEWVWLIAKIIGACSIAAVLLFCVCACAISGRESEWEREHDDAEREMDAPERLVRTFYGPAECKHPDTCEAPECYCHPSVAVADTPARQGSYR